MPKSKFVSSPRPLRCTLQGDDLVFAWARHQEYPDGKLICEFSAPRNWTDRTLSAFLLLRLREEIPTFVERFGTLGNTHHNVPETASTWLVWVARARAILNFHKAVLRNIRPARADEKLMAELISRPVGKHIMSRAFHGTNWGRRFFLMLAISEWLNSPVPFEGQGCVIRVGVRKTGNQITTEHQPTCLLGFVGLQILQRLQSASKKVNARCCVECNQKYQPGRTTQKYCLRCIKGKVRQRDNMRAYRERQLRTP